MRNGLLVPKIALKIPPRTFGEDNPSKKSELKEKILNKIGNALEEYKKKCRGRKLSLEVTFYVSREKESGSARDLDNMIKLLGDTLPEHMDVEKTQLGLGLIEGTRDDAIYEIVCRKILVSKENDEAIEFEIFEWKEEVGGLEIRSAEKFAKDKHKYQLRKDKKTEYWYHLERVVNNSRYLGIDDESIMIAGWLHDTIEDTTTDYDDIEKQFGKEVAQLVASVTKDKRLPEGDRELAYCAQVEAASWKAQVVKLCDVWANIADLPSGYSDHDERVAQAAKKLPYLDAIRNGLSQNRDKIPNLDQGIHELNELLSVYGKEFKL